MKHFETSAKDGLQVNEAFIEMVKMGIKRESANQIIMPDSLNAGGLGSKGGVKLKPNQRGNTKVQSSGKCC